MKNEEKLIEVMAELLAEVHEMCTDTKAQLTTLNQDVQEMKKEMAKMNPQISENTRAIMKLADNTNIIERIVKLETKVFKKAS